MTRDGDQEGEADLSPEAYAAWRATRLGRVTEALELVRVFELAGSLGGLRVLDVGTGDGSCAIGGAMRGARAVGLDPDPRMLSAARTRSSTRGLRVPVVRGIAEALPFPDASFDVVLAVTTLCLVTDVEKCALEMARVLVPGGRLVVGELGRWSIWAARRRLRARQGSCLWRRTRFWSRSDLRGPATRAGLLVKDVLGAIHFPPWAPLAALFGRIDHALGDLRAPGAAFLVLLAEKPTEAS